MELLSVLSEKTSNSLDDLKRQDFHIVLGLFNSIKTLNEKREKAEKEAQKNYSSENNIPSISSLQSQIRMPSMPRIPGH